MRILPVILLLAVAVVAGAATDDGVLQLGDVRFPHESHFLELELECVTCHHETNATQLVIPHEEYFADFWINCKTCHHDNAELVPPQSCSNCHHDSPSNIADETLSAKVVVHRSCWTCHEVGTGQTASRACVSCHANALSKKRPTSEDQGDES